MKIAVFLPNWLGDLAMATPTLRAMRRHFGPQARMVGILRPYLADVLAGTGWLDEQWFFDPRAKDRSLHALGGGAADAGRAVRHGRAADQLAPHGLVAWLGRAKQRIGYVRYGRGPLLTGKLYPRRVGRQIVPMPMVETYLELARALGCGEESPRLELATVEADERSADGVFRAARTARRSVGVVALEFQRGLRRLEALAGRILRRSWPGGSSTNWTTTCWSLAGRRSATSPGGSSGLAGRAARVLDGRSADGPGHGQGVHPPLPVDGFDRQRPAARGRRAGPAGGHDVRPDVARLEREPHAAGGQSGARPGLHRLPQAGLSARAIIAACATCGGHGFCGRQAVCASGESVRNRGKVTSPHNETLWIDASSARCWSGRGGTVSRR